MKKINKIFLFFLIFVFLFSTLYAVRGKNFYLRKFSHFNRHLKTFKADFIQRKYINIIEDFDEPQEGELFLKKYKKEMFLKRIINKPGKIFMLVKGGMAVIYYPKRAQVIKKSFNKSKSRYLTFGVGTSLNGLEKNFFIKFVGEKKLGKHICGVLSLTPKKEKLKSYFKKINLWVDSKSGIVLRQVITEDDGDYTTIDFKNIKVNTKLKNSVFKLKIPSGVDVIS